MNIIAIMIFIQDVNNGEKRRKDKEKGEENEKKEKDEFILNPRL